MTAETLTVTVPASLAKDFEEANEEFILEVLIRGLRVLKVERALEEYARGGISFGAAARMAGVSRSELARHAYARGMEPTFSPETLAEELG